MAALFNLVEAAGIEPAVSTALQGLRSNGGEMLTRRLRIASWDAK